MSSFWRGSQMKSWSCVSPWASTSSKTSSPTWKDALSEKVSVGMRKPASPFMASRSTRAPSAEQGSSVSGTNEPYCREPRRPSVCVLRENALCWFMHA